MLTFTKKQDETLHEWVKSGQHVKVIVNNGYQERGRILEFGESALTLVNDKGEEEIILLRNVTTIKREGK